MSLAAARAAGADVRVVYSPLDAVDLAPAEPAREVVFLGIGFETTAPTVAAAIVEARRRGVSNFSVLALTRPCRRRSGPCSTSARRPSPASCCPGT